MTNYKLASDYSVPEVRLDQPAKTMSNGYVPDMSVENIVPNRYQPRSRWDAEKLMELSDSIRENGVIEPLIVTEISQGRYEIIAGERRFRASKIAGLKTVPIVIKEATPQQMLELAVVENVQRADLNPLEEARAFENLAREFNLTHDQIARKVGCSRPAVANKVRLLQLPDSIKNGILENKISEGHARAMLGLKNDTVMIGLYTKIVRDRLSVRATEEIVRKLNIGTNTKEKLDSVPKLDLRPYKTRVHEIFGGTKATVKQIGKKLKVEIKFDDEESLNEFLTRTSNT